jgi:hypothetical protein
MPAYCVKRMIRAPGRAYLIARAASPNSAHFPISGSEVEVWNNRDTSSGGYMRNDEGERAATAKGYFAMRAATREKMGGLSANRK